MAGVGVGEHARIDMEVSELPQGSLRVLHVEDDLVQQMGLQITLESIEHSTPGLTIPLTTVGTATEAIKATSIPGSFDLVLLDYMLPDGNGDTVIAHLRESVGPSAAIIMLSSDAQEGPLQRCWLDLGADSYRLKPISSMTLRQLFSYTFDKRRLVQKRRRCGSATDLASGHFGEDDGAEDGHAAKRLAGRQEAPSAALSREPSEPDLSSLPSDSQPAPSIVDLLAYGRRGPVHLAYDQTHGREPVAMKVYSAGVVRGAPPPVHEHVNAVLGRQLKGAQCVELRALCEGGEFTDVLAMQAEDGGVESEEVYMWTEQLLSAVAHCHAHGAVHGQLRAENLLLSGADGGSLRVTGFSCCDLCADAEAACGFASPRMPSRDVAVSSAAAAVGASGRAGGGVGGVGGSSSSSSSAIGGTGGGSAGGGGCELSERLSQRARVALRPYDPRLDAPELEAREHATPKELAACDVYACGLLLTCFLTGRPDASRLPLLRRGASSGTGLSPMMRSRSVQLSPGTLGANGRDLDSSSESNSPANRSRATSSGASSCTASPAQWAGLAAAPAPPPGCSAQAATVRKAPKIDMSSFDRMARKLPGTSDAAAAAAATAAADNAPPVSPGLSGITSAVEMISEMSLRGDQISGMGLGGVGGSYSGSRGAGEAHSLDRMIELATRMLQHDPAQRPTSTEVLEQYFGRAALQQAAQQVELT